MAIHTIHHLCNIWKT